ncbi:MAG: FAD-binding oxidoreductase [Actinomycetota bacterium]|nr:FAD-binding oxidoreductase [Actinomycetota bacterium]
MGERGYGSYSLWLETAGESLDPRPPLPGDTSVDVAIVGAGYTGLWTAYYLLRAQPDLRVALVEKEIAGFGASGRNGGWCSGLFAAPRAKVARAGGRDAAVAMERAMFATVDEVGRVLAEEGIDADFHKGGTLTLVTSPAQLGRVRAEIEDDRAWGFGEYDFRWMERDELEGRVRVAGALGARFTPHCARLHPGRLVRGLARRTEELGAAIYERTPAVAIEPGKVVTELGTVRAGFVVRATEGYTPGLRRMRRTLVPLYSLMIATEPLPHETWDAVGWDGCETLHDGRHLLVYAQRTGDGRIALGGRGAPYHFGSRVDDAHDRDPRIFEGLQEVLVSLFPSVSGYAITHRWGGPLGVPRDWFSSVGCDRESGLAWAGGYVGDGVSTANLAGRTLTDLILGRDGDLVRLPWVNHRSRRWEPEPLRWLGVNLGLKAMAHADRVEARTGRPTRRGELVKKLIGL